MSHDMIKPKPASELVVRQATDRILYITTHTNDSGEWLAKNAPEYGNFYPATFESHSMLVVADGYDVKDVMRYLASYNVGGEPGRESE